MKRFVKYLIVAVLCLAFALSLAACGGGGSDGGSDSDETPVQLTMTTPTYDDATKKVTWSKVPNASGYCLTLMGVGINKTETLSATEYTVAEQTDGQFIISIIALGDGISYCDSTEKRIWFTYEVPPTPPVTLDAPQLSKSNYSIRWTPVANAYKYEFTMRFNGKLFDMQTVGQNEFYDAVLGLNEYLLEKIYKRQSGFVNFKITALGNGTTTLNSTVAELEFDYVHVPATYQDIIDMLLPKVEAAIKALPEHSLSSNFRIEHIYTGGMTVVRYTLGDAEHSCLIYLGGINTTDLDRAFVHAVKLAISNSDILRNASAQEETLANLVADYIIRNSIENPPLTMEDVDAAFFGSTEFDLIGICLNDGRSVLIYLDWNINITDSNVDIWLAEFEVYGIDNYIDDIHVMSF